MNGETKEVLIEKGIIRKLLMASIIFSDKATASKKVISRKFFS